MPTATEFFGTVAHNLGPLTTTYAAPSSCATSINDVDVVFVNATSPATVLVDLKCEIATYGNCFPSGKERDSSALRSTPLRRTLMYFSPGVACPAGWKTVGALAHTESGKFSASGVLAEGPPLSDLERARNVWRTDAWKSLLDESETLAYCCPNEYRGNVNGYCISTLGPVTSYSYSTPCGVVYNFTDYYTLVSSVDGLSYSKGVFSYIEPTGDAPGETLTLDLGMWVGATSNDVSDVVVATYMPAVPLVHKKSDMDKKNGDSETEDASTTNEETDESAASTIPRHGVISTLGMTLGVLAGMGMLWF